MGMSVILSSSILLMATMTPLKISFLTVLVSLMVSAQLYWLMDSIFPSASVIVSFSSGMMILFCYCAMLTSYESKNKKLILTLMMTSVMTLSMWSNSDSQETSNSVKSKMSSSVSSPFILLAMTVVIITMMSINKAIFNPSKPLTSSY